MLFLIRLRVLIPALSRYRGYKNEILHFYTAIAYTALQNDLQNMTHQIKNL